MNDIDQMRSFILAEAGGKAIVHIRRWTTVAHDYVACGEESTHVPGLNHEWSCSIKGFPGF